MSPARQPPKEPGDGEPAPDHRPPVRVLVIEDDVLNMKLIRAVLKLEGYLVIEARDGEDGIARAREQAPDVILVDIQLPGMDGLTTTRLLREEVVPAEVPIIAVSSHAMSGDRDRALAAGCDDHITKPIDTRSFSDRISRHLPRG